jgi:hypothetical protein
VEPGLLDRDQRVALELDRVILKGLREYEVSRELAGERGSRLQQLGRGASAHLLDHRGERERSSSRKSIENGAQPKPVIPATVRDVDRRQAPSVCSSWCGFRRRR